MGFYPDIPAGDLAVLWVERDADGLIKGVYANRQPGYAEEWVEQAELEKPTEVLRDNLRAALKVECNRRISTYFPDTTQRTMLARGDDLADLNVCIDRHLATYGEHKTAIIGADRATLLPYDVTKNWPSPPWMAPTEESPHDPVVSTVDVSQESEARTQDEPVGAKEPAEADAATIDDGNGADDGDGLTPLDETIATDQVVRALDEQTLRAALRSAVNSYATTLWTLSPEDYARVIYLNERITNPDSTPDQVSDARNEMGQHGGWAEFADALTVARRAKLKEIDSLPVDMLHSYDITTGWPVKGDG